MKNPIRTTLAVASLLTAAFLAPAAKAQVAVDLELILLVDVSGSVDATEYGLQKTGYVNAFNSASIQTAIAAGALGKIAVTYVEWSGASQQSQLVGWTLIDSVTAANNFATAISGTSRAYSGQTAPGSAINFAYPLFTNGFDGTRLVIDVSGDGAQNDGATTSTARNAALAFGVNTINGVVILGETGLEAWYNANIKGGTGGFVESASTFSDFGAAIDRKLVREIQQTAVPEPSTYGLIGAAVLMGAVILRRKKAAVRA